MLDNLRSVLLFGERERSDYDDAPVEYCADCHSLAIKSYGVSDGWDGAYCAKCGSTDIRLCTIDQWLEEEEKRKKK